MWKLGYSNEKQRGYFIQTDGIDCGLHFDDYIGENKVLIRDNGVSFELRYRRANGNLEIEGEAREILRRLDKIAKVETFSCEIAYGLSQIVKMVREQASR